VVGLLEYERESWAMMMKQLASEEGGDSGVKEAATRNPVARIGPHGYGQTGTPPNSSVSIQG